MPALRRWPEACDFPACKRLLQNGYEQARSKPLMGIMLKSEPTESEMRLDLPKRLGSTDPDALKWLMTAQVGSMRDYERRPYASNVRHSYPNVVVEPLTLRPGTTHVAVGFVDLGGLADAVIRDTGDAEPVRWVGYDASPYAVAKALVIRQMLTDGADPLDIMQVGPCACMHGRPSYCACNLQACISSQPTNQEGKACMVLLPVHAQVWYSAAWSAETYSAFKTSLTALIQQCEQTQSHPDVVMALLKHWAQAKVTLEEVSAAAVCACLTNASPDMCRLCMHVLCIHRSCVGVCKHFLHPNCIPSVPLSCTA